MSQVNSILALKLQRQERMAQQEREDKMRDDATMQASMQHLISGQQRLADQQLARDDWKLKFEQQKYNMELARQKQDLEYRKYVEESRWQRTVDAAEINKDKAQAALYAAEAKNPKAFRAQTNIGLTPGQQVGLGQDLIGSTRKDLGSQMATAKARAATARGSLGKLRDDLQSAQLSKMGASGRDRAWKNLAKSYGVTSPGELDALAAQWKSDVQAAEEEHSRLQGVQRQLSEIPYEEMTTSGVRMSIGKLMAGQSQRGVQPTIGPAAAPPIKAPPPTVPQGATPATHTASGQVRDPEIMDIYRKNLKKSE